MRLSDTCFSVFISEYDSGASRCGVNQTMDVTVVMLFLYTVFPTNTCLL